MTARDPILSGPPTAAALSGASSSRPDALIVPADWCLSIQGEAGGRQSGERKPSLPPRSSLFSVLKSLGSGVGRPRPWQPPRSTQGSVICPESRILVVSTVPDTEPVSVPEAPWNVPILAVLTT